MSTRYQYQYSGKECYSPSVGCKLLRDGVKISNHMYTLCAYVITGLHNWWLFKINSQHWTATQMSHLICGLWHFAPCYMYSVLSWTLNTSGIQPVPDHQPTRKATCKWTYNISDRCQKRLLNCCNCSHNCHHCHTLYPHLSPMDMDQYFCFCDNLHIDQLSKPLLLHAGTMHWWHPVNYCNMIHGYFSSFKIAQLEVLVSFCL